MTLKIFTTCLQRRVHTHIAVIYVIVNNGPIDQSRQCYPLKPSSDFYVHTLTAYALFLQIILIQYNKIVDTFI